MCKASNINYTDSVFIDETTRQANKNSPMQRFQNFSDVTRRGLIPKYSHEPSVYVIGGISRRGPTPLIVFEGHMDSLGFQSLCDQFLIPVFTTTVPNGHY